MKINHIDDDGNALTGGTFTLYAEESVFSEGSSLGTYQWKKIKSGLKSGDTVCGLGKNYYKLVQETFPDGYKKYVTPEFSIGIKTDGGSPVVTATDNNSWTKLDVADGVVQVAAKNVKESSKQSNDKVTQTESTDKDSNSKPETATQTNNSTNNHPSDVVVTYYKDSVKESSMHYGNSKNISNGMLDTKYISDRSNSFKGYTLQKITLNGEEVDSVPKLVELGATICFYYVTDSE